MDILLKFACLITDAIRQDMYNREFLDMCKACGGRRWTLSLAKVPQDLQTDRAMRHLMGDFARRAAREAGSYREHLSDEPGLIQIQEAARAQASQHLVNGRTRAVRSCTHQCSYEERYEHHQVPDCGKEVQADEKFCYGCGTKLEWRYP